MTGRHNRIGQILLTALFGAALILGFACSREEESLKIVIEDSTDTEASKEVGDGIGGDDGDIAKTAPETEPGMELGMDAPPVVDEPKTPPETPESEGALAMRVLDVMAKAVDDDDFKRIAKAIPVRVMIFGLPKNRAWNVRVMFQDTELMTVVIDDNSREVLKKNVQKEHDIKTLARRTKPGVRRMEEQLDKLNLGYAGALGAALEDERFPKIDYAKHVAVAVLLGRGRDRPVWHVVFMPGEDKLNIIATIDDYGNVLSVREEERKVKR
ncbi:MAG: hypothetical protein JW984_08135 [Deltaproteobacteria bacterium]|uniref:Uncharacterized protein n=1 Tax=Candidatus Zymogenus saltonus TaxID=2844893 RepID=A0A9D8KFE8_9DELT|nr:hypothetical protein [Candidatus Zymogenus saltonus]